MCIRDRAWCIQPLGQDAVFDHVFGRFVGEFWRPFGKPVGSNMCTRDHPKGAPGKEIGQRVSEGAPGHQKEPMCFTYSKSPHAAGIAIGSRVCVRKIEGGYVVGPEMAIAICVFP